MNCKDFVNVVMSYYKKHGRHDLPWRSGNEGVHDSYKILVSEMMLQQTQVSRVIPKYEAFLKRFPNVETLAMAELGEVYELWQGLGYNRRARFLRDTARAVYLGQICVPRSDLDKKEVKIAFPDTIEGLERLPGVGPYTARAVYTFAYNKQCVVIETNVRACVLHHFFPKANKGSVTDARIEKIMGDCMCEVARKKIHPRAWCSALMDYGTYIKSTQVNPSRKSRTYVVQKKFKGSVREVRGEILRQLGRSTERKIKSSAIFSLPFEKEKIDAALVGLLKDGMLLRKGVWVELGK
jgi:A/G-specific adenine glycosylase